MIHPSFDATDPVLATIAWSRLAEPGDLAAGHLIAAMGAVAALDWLLSVEADASDQPPGQSEHPGWARATANWQPRLAGMDPRRELEMIHRLDGEVILATDDRWPQGLADLHEAAPICLWVRGDPALIGTPAVALVGSRACTRYGEHVTGDLAGEAAVTALTVTSGGAFGIDAVAHRSAMTAGGRTIAYQAGGVDRFYPAAHRDLLADVVNQGAVVSEAPPGSAPMRQRFLQRNRLIAAATAGVIVVEAAWRSGALNTAHHAAGLLRPVGAVPGPVTSAASAGCHRLIRDQVATCVTDAGDVRELLGPIGSTPSAGDTRGGAQPGLLDDLDPDTAQVLDALPARAGAHTDALVRAAGLAPTIVLQALGTLELAGRVTRDGSAWKRTRP